MVIGKLNKVCAAKIYSGKIIFSSIQQPAIQYTAESFSCNRHLLNNYNNIIK